VNNTAFGDQALFHNNAGDDNTAIGQGALADIVDGTNNIALGNAAGGNHTSGNGNIYIGNPGVGIENDSIRIGNSQTTTIIAGIYNSETPSPGMVAKAVFVGSDGRLYANPNLVASVTPDEFQMLQRTVEEQKATIEQQRAQFEIKVAQQQKSLDTLTARLKEQNDQLQRVSVRMEQNRVTPKKVVNTK